MGETKRKSAQEIVETHIWNPRYMWQFVRRAKAYQHAALAFYEAAKACEDRASIDVYNGWGTVSTERQDSIKDEYMDLRGPHPEFLFQHAPGEARFFETDYARAFQRRFGDVLWLPISPEIASFHNALLWVWRLFPCHTQPKAEGSLLSKHQQDGDKDMSRNVESITLAVNWSCPDEAIKQYLRVELENILSRRRLREPPILRSFRISRQRAEDLVTAFDMHKANKSNEEIGRALKEPPSPGTEFYRHGLLAWQEAEEMIRHFERDLPPAIPE